MFRHRFSIIPLLLVLAACLAASACAPGIAWRGKPAPLYGEAEGFYNYCPSSILANGVETHFFCSNQDPFKIVDHIAMVQTSRAGGELLAAKKTVLGPGPGKWDSFHVCDPSVVKGRFLYRGQTYGWAMFFLGEDHAPKVCMHNQIGVAFAHEPGGPWVKYEGNPVVPFDSYDFWGAGQPSALSLDHAGKILLTYTLGGETGTRVLTREADFSDMSRPRLGPPHSVSARGLRNGREAPIILRNAEFAMAPSLGKVFLAWTLHEEPAVNGMDVVGDHIQIACANTDEFLAGKPFSWTVLADVGKELTGAPRNHNAAFLRDPYGALGEPGRLTLILTESEISDLWTYRLFRLEGRIKGRFRP